MEFLRNKRVQLIHFLHEKGRISRIMKVGEPIHISRDEDYLPGRGYTDSRWHSVRHYYFEPENTKSVIQISFEEREGVITGLRRRNYTLETIGKDNLPEDVKTALSGPED